MSQSTTPMQKFTITRLLSAPRELVWKAFTEPERMREWWGPKGYKVLVSNMDFRVGGTYHYGMQSPEGESMWGKFNYLEIDEPNRMVFIDYFSDENGGITRHPLSPTWPLQLKTTFTFEDEKGKTKLTIQWEPQNVTDEEAKTFADNLASMNQGWNGTLEQLEEYLSNIQK
jgi:uncharacterized protein YndB with AHSA1/START domain